MSVDIKNGSIAMQAVANIVADLPGVHITGGLSNISYGLPQRRIINRCFLSMMIAHGFDSAIMDPLDKDIMALMMTADMLKGNDNFCMKYIKAVRAEKIVA
jgi:5-methyltetrahydrofolate--homocysteine methyltransferase